jgi:uncharacterized protein (TIGR03086 family)
MDPISLFERSGDVFLDRLAQVPDDAWSKPSPCADWTVRIVAAHVVNGFGLIGATLVGPPLDPATRNLDQLGTDPVAVGRAALAEALEALRRPGALDRIVTPPAGPMPASRFTLVRMSDNVIHTWDLARGAGLDESLPDDLVAAVMTVAGSQLLTRGRQAGVYGPPVTADDDADPQIALLAQFGRTG